MRCMCGATDCPSCGRAQGYEVVKINGKWVNPEYCAKCGEQYVSNEGDICRDCEDEVCPKCGSFDTEIGLHDGANWYNKCTQCFTEWTST